MSLFLKVSIILLVGLTIASISLLFIGDFEGRGERVFSTFALFAVFVVLTAIDTGRNKSSDWYAPVALIANTYILGLSLVVIWMTEYTYYPLIFDIFWGSLVVVVVVRLVILCCELLLRSGQKAGESVTRFAFVTSVLAVLAGILFTAPVGISVFRLSIPDTYWKISTAVLILTALGLSVTLLLRWTSGADERAERAERAAEAQQQFTQQQFGYVAPMMLPAAQQLAAQQPAAPAAPGTAAQGALLPWPRFADGTPIPAGPDGQPNFSVPGAPQPPQL